MTPEAPTDGATDAVKRFTATASVAWCPPAIDATGTGTFVPPGAVEGEQIMSMHGTITVTRAAFASGRQWLARLRLATPALPANIGADREELFENGGGI